MKYLPLFILTLFCFITSFSLNAQLSTGQLPSMIFLKTQGTYSAEGILGRIQFKSFLQGVQREHAAIRAIMTDVPTPEGDIPTDLVFLTGASTQYERFRITSNGMIGINTPTPSALLQVVQYENSIASDHLFQITTGRPDSTIEFAIIRESPYQISARLQGNMEINRGKLSVNTDYVPTEYHLAVKGKIIGTGMKIETFERWPDYVFDTSYYLNPIENIAQFIDKNRHLPGIPSADEIACNGFEIGDMQARAIEKIEELFLYLVAEKEAREQEIAELKLIITSFENRLQELEK